MDKVICEYCFQPFARADYKSMSLPMTHDQFHSLMPENGVPAPFVPGTEWHQWRCPFCKLRPFYTDDAITIINGRGVPRQVFLKKIEADRSMAERNQAKIDEIFGAERVEKPTPIDIFQNMIVKHIKSGRKVLLKDFEKTFGKGAELVDNREITTHRVANDHSPEGSKRKLRKAKKGKK